MTTWVRRQCNRTYAPGQGLEPRTLGAKSPTLYRLSSWVRFIVTGYVVDTHVKGRHSYKSSSARRDDHVVRVTFPEDARPHSQVLIAVVSAGSVMTIVDFINLTAPRDWWRHVHVVTWRSRRRLRRVTAALFVCVFPLYLLWISFLTRNQQSLLYSVHIKAVNRH